MDKFNKIIMEKSIKCYFVAIVILLVISAVAVVYFLVNGDYEWARAFWYYILGLSLSFTLFNYIKCLCGLIKEYREITDEQMRVLLEEKGLIDEYEAENKKLEEKINLQDYTIKAQHNNLGKAVEIINQQESALNELMGGSEIPTNNHDDLLHIQYPTKDKILGNK